MPGDGSLSITHVVCTDSFAGVERYVADVSRQQAASGHRVTVLGGSPTAMPAAVADAAVEWRPARSTLDALRELRRARPGVVHVHLTAAEVAAILTRPFHRSPIVATLHLARTRGHGPVRPMLYRLLPRALDAQIAISSFVAQASGQPATVIHNGVPWGLPDAPREQVVLMAQRLEPEKHSAVGVRAWARSGLADEGWRLDIAGDGAEVEELRSLAEQLGVGPSVRFLGFVDDARLRMTTASIFLAPTPADGLGLSVIEAMAAGTPVVAAAGGGHLETVGRVTEQHLFEPGSVEGCAAALSALAGDPDERVRYAASLQAEWARSFTIEGHCRRLDEVYRRVSANR